MIHTACKSESIDRREDLYYRDDCANELDGQRSSQIVKIARSARPVDAWPAAAVAL